jgi:hypothetical protein
MNHLIRDAERRDLQPLDSALSVVAVDDVGADG